MKSFFQNNTCYVNGYCFDDKEVNPNNWCTVCNPETNEFINRTIQGKLFYKNIKPDCFD